MLMYDYRVGLSGVLYENTWCDQNGVSLPL
jgi:hypothetical protein